MSESIIIDRQRLLRGRGALRPLGWTYRTTGPDGCLFTNNSIGDLRLVLRKHYGRDMVIVEPWKEAARG